MIFLLYGPNFLLFPKEEKEKSCNNLKVGERSWVRGLVIRREGISTQRICSTLQGSLLFFIPFLLWGILVKKRWDLRCLFDYARKDHRDPLHTYPLEGIRASVARGLRVLRFEWFLFCFARQGSTLCHVFSKGC